MRSLAFLLPPCVRGRHRLHSPDQLCRTAGQNRFIPFGREATRLLPALGLLLVLSGCGTDNSAVLAPTAAEASLPATGAPPVAAPAVPVVDPPAPIVLPTTAPVPVAATPKLDPAVPAIDPAASKESRRYNAGENPEYARKCGWPVNMPEPLPGSILPAKRIVAYYGNPLSKRMGALGEYPEGRDAAPTQGETQAWEKADPATPVQPALHLIAVVAQGEPGKAGKYRMVMPDEVVNQGLRLGQGGQGRPVYRHPDRP